MVNGKPTTRKASEAASAEADDAPAAAATTRTTLAVDHCKYTRVSEDSMPTGETNEDITKYCCPKGSSQRMELITKGKRSISDVDRKRVFKRSGASNEERMSTEE